VPIHKLSRFFPVFLIAAAVFFAVMSMVNDSQIVDEIPHVGAGYSYLVKQDMRLNPEHPPLAKDLAAIPLLFMGLKQTAFESAHWLNTINSQWEFGRLLIYNSGNNGDDIKFFSRLPMLLFYILSAIIIFKWGGQLYGETGGIIALMIFLFSPTVMAHSRFVTTDVPALFGVLLSIYTFTNYLKQPTRRHLLIAGLAFGVALLLKFSTFLLGPFLIAIGIFHGLIFDRHKYGHWKYGLRTIWGSLAIFAIGFFGVVWLVYGFHVWNYPPEQQFYDTKALLSSFGNRTVADAVIWMADKPFIRALGQYLFGFLMVVQRSSGGNTIYFLGEIVNKGGPIYFPFVYFIKEPLAWWILAFIALAGATYRVASVRRGWKRTFQWAHDHFAEVVMVGWLVFYWIISIRSTLNIGVRHLLPTYPFVIMLVAGQIARTAEWLRHHEKPFIKAFSVTIALLLGWYMYENIRIFPYYLTYFNQTVGGPSGGYRYVTDSNLDWGQDLKRLSLYVKENNIEAISLDYFGWADPYFYMGNQAIGVSAGSYRDARDFLRRNQTDGWIAISATFFQQATSPSADNPNKKLDYLWLKAYEPVTVIGNSIFVWHITE